MAVLVTATHVVPFRRRSPCAAPDAFAAASRGCPDRVVVVGSQAIHAQPMKLPPIAFRSDEADVYPRNHPERAEEVDAAIGELSPFHDTHGYYGHGVSPATAILPHGWEQRAVRLSKWRSYAPLVDQDFRVTQRV